MKKFKLANLDIDVEAQGCSRKETWLALRFEKDRGGNFRLDEVAFHPAESTGYEFKHECVEEKLWGGGLKAVAIYLLLAARLPEADDRMEECGGVVEAGLLDGPTTWGRACHSHVDKGRGLMWPPGERRPWAKWRTMVFGLEKKGSVRGAGTLYDGLVLLCHPRRTKEGQPPRRIFELRLPRCDGCIQRQGVLVYLSEEEGQPVRASPDQILAVAHNIECKIRSWSPRVPIAEGGIATVEIVTPRPSGGEPAQGEQGLASRAAFDQRLFRDELTGVAYAEWRGSPEVFGRSLMDARGRLESQPHDVYLRVMITWAVVLKGTPDQVVDVLQETARWLDSSSEPCVDDSAMVNRALWQMKSQAIHDGQINESEREFVLRHLEDTLVRVAIARWFKLHGRASPLGKIVRSVYHDPERPPVLKEIFDSAKRLEADKWFARTVTEIEEWINRDAESALARVCWLWFSARGKSREEMSAIIERSWRWLGRHPDEAAVRFVNIWLGVLSERLGDRMDRLIDETRQWVATTSRIEECLIREQLLWLVGSEGNERQTQEEMRTTKKWLAGHTADDFVRVAYLFYLVRRRGTPEQRARVIDETRQFLGESGGKHPLTALALDLLVAVDRCPG